MLDLLQRRVGRLLLRRSTRHPDELCQDPPLDHQLLGVYDDVPMDLSLCLLLECG